MTIRSLLAAFALSASLLLAQPAAFGQGGGGGGGRGGGMFAMMGGGEMDAPISSDDLKKIGDLLKFSPDQLTAAEAMHKAMLAGYQIKADEFRKLREATVEEFRESRDPTVWQDFAPKMEAFRTTRKEAETAFMGDLQAVLTPEQETKWPSVLRMRTRESMNRQGPTIAGERADLFKIVERMNVPAEKMTAITPILDAYEVELDRDLKNRIAVEDETRGATREIFSGGGDQTKMQELIDKNRAAANKVRDVNRNFARQLASALPPEFSEKFNSEFKKQSFPEVYRERAPERSIAAAMAMDTLDESQRAAVQSLAESYGRDVKAVNEAHEKAIEENEQTFTASRMMTFGGWNNPAMDEIRTQRRTLEDTTINKLKAILTPEQAAKLPERGSDRGEGRGGRQGGGQGGQGGMGGGAGGGENPDRPRRQRPNRENPAGANPGNAPTPPAAPNN